MKVAELWLSDETDLRVPNQEGKQRKGGKPLLIPAKAILQALRLSRSQSIVPTNNCSEVLEVQNSLLIRLSPLYKMYHKLTRNTQN